LSQSTFVLRKTDAVAFARHEASRTSNVYPKTLICVTNVLCQVFSRNKKAHLSHVFYGTRKHICLMCFMGQESTFASCILWDKKAHLSHVFYGTRKHICPMSFFMKYLSHISPRQFFFLESRFPVLPHVKCKHQYVCLVLYEKLK
jgi:hypothetical protein